MLKKVALIIALILLLSSRSIFAQEQAYYSANYQAEYFLSDKANSSDFNVKFTTAITNLSNDVYVKKFSISFPLTFAIENVSAQDDSGVLQPVITTSEKSTEISLEFNNPKTGKNSLNHFYLNYTQKNLFRRNGAVWEVILPTVENKQSSNYKVIVNLASQSPKQLSIAKPLPTSQTANQIVWDNPETKTIYAVFGSAQYYYLDLTYHLKNPRIIPVMTEMALPPDTEYQKIIVESLRPGPYNVYLDKDGNYMARYLLSPSEDREVSFKGYAVVSSQIRDEFLNNNISDPKDKRFVATDNKYWKLTKTGFENLNTVNDIYDFVTEKLVYNFSQSGVEKERLGADKALEQPDRAVCVEFTDLFIALARKKGFPTREIEGFGFTQDPRFRPLSLLTDVLHAWPEYYDPGKGIWVPVDPTWENTSGIDYFSSFDLNHITFVRHSNDPEYPLPAGMYKTQNSQDIIVEPIAAVPATKDKLSLEVGEFPKTTVAKQSYRQKILLTNAGNTYRYATELNFKAKNAVIDMQSFQYPLLAPLEKKEFFLKLTPSDVKTPTQSNFVVFLNDKLAYSQTVNIEPFYFGLAKKISLAGFLLFLPLAVLFLKTRKK